LFTGVSSDKSPGDSLLFKQSALRGVSYALTGYAPELNPDEMVWNYMKRTGTARKPLAKEESLQDRIDVELQQNSTEPRSRSVFFPSRNCLLYQ
jgi:hypothetical protein